MREGLLDLRRPATTASGEALHDERVAHESFGNDESVGIEAMIVLGVRNGAFQHLLDLTGDTLVAEFEFGQSLLDLLATDQLSQKVELLWADAQHAQHSLGFVVRERALGFWLAHLTSSWPSCRPRVRNRYGSGRTRRTCDRSCLR